jgi:hypothetical protein
MRNKFYALFVALAFVLNGVGTAFADTKTSKTANQTSQLVALLPTSDGVMTIDMKRLLSEAMPQILSGKPQMLGDVNAKIDEINQKTGLDLRQFEQVAVGVSAKQITAQEVDLEPFILARGKYNAAALIALAKLASKGKYREEKIGACSVFVFSGKEIIEQNKPQTKNSLFDKMIDRVINSLTKEVAVTAYDNNTLAFGSLNRVRDAFESKSRVNEEVSSLINRKPNAVVSFGGKLPNGLSKFIDLDNDELGTTLDTIRQVSGALEISGGNTTISIAAKTLKPEQAQSLLDTLQGLQMVGKALLGSSRSSDKQVYGRMIDNAKITRNAAEVMLDLQVPQNDINILLGVK